MSFRQTDVDELNILRSKGQRLADHSFDLCQCPARFHNAFSGMGVDTLQHVRDFMNHHVGQKKGRQERGVRHERGVMCVLEHTVEKNFDVNAFEYQSISEHASRQVRTGGEGKGDYDWRSLLIRLRLAGVPSYTDACLGEHARSKSFGPVQVETRVARIW